jgi:lipopolysaccharide/colanic/teichoic acid biosynthesis glycosyltransferase
MAVALHLTVQEPLNPSVSTTMKVKAFTRHILRVGFISVTPDYEYGKDEILFTNSTAKAVQQHLASGEKFDAVFISPDQGQTDIALVKEFAKEYALPVVLYSAKFDADCKEIALKRGLDDYFNGNITASSLKRLDFIHKLKTYKNKRGNKPYVAAQVADVPKIKLWALKRTFDIIISAGMIIALLPIMIITAILIKLDSKGPIFYIAKRAGSGYKIFNFYKFRSMRTGADAELQKLTHMNQYTESAEQSVFYKIKNDPRVTRLGQFLRDTSLDELPQLFNVLKGDMSLVGNRPLPLYEAEKLTKDQIAWRFLAPAGITGLWQVTKRGKDNMSEEERIQLDMEYAMKNSFLYDLKILFSTIPALLQKVQA